MNASIFIRAIAFAGSVLVTLAMVSVIANYALPEAPHTQLAAIQPAAIQR